MRLPAVRASALRLSRTWTPTLRYLMETEVHVYAFSIAANVLLSTWPFLLVLVSIFRYVLNWPEAERAVYYALKDYFPGDVGAFIARNITYDVHPIEYTSLFLLLFTANGIFEPLEVALNRAWGIPKNRSFVRNQIVSMGLIFACGSLALLSIVLTAANPFPQFSGALGLAAGAAQLIFFKAAAIPVAILMLFLIYWLLPNRKLPARDLIAPAILVGVALELLKYANLLAWPWMAKKLEREYGVFINSVTIILWSFLASMIVLAGAEWTARVHRDRIAAAGALREDRA